MTNEKKQLLLKDICARLPYGVICKWESDGFSNVGELTDICHQKSCNGFQYWDGYLNFDGEDIPVEVIKPYLRPMSSMTEEEEEEYWNIINLKSPEMPVEEIPSIENIAQCSIIVLDWLLSKGFDIRGLIQMGVALEAPDGMYKT